MEIQKIRHPKEAKEIKKEREAAQEPSLSNYNDYRSFLRHYYEYRKLQDAHSLRPYSYSVFSAAADIKSPNYLKLVMSGQRNLSPAMAVSFARGLQLNKEESEEFCALVRFNQAKDPTERNRFLRELSEIRVQKKLSSGEIDRQTWDKVPGWLTWVIYAMADQKGVEFNPEAVAALFKGRANLDAVKIALDRLFSSGELVATDQGGARQARQLIDSPEAVPPALIKKLQSELIHLGLESLYNESPADREFGALTLALTNEEFELIKFELRKLRKKINTDIKVQRKASPAERVYQLNIQFFAVTDSVKSK
jgi:uncharacterized protein (TIGR02147 family)